MNICVGGVLKYVFYFNYINFYQKNLKILFPGL